MFDGLAPGAVQPCTILITVSGVECLVDPDYRILEMNSRVAILNAPSQRCPQLSPEKLELVTDERPDIGLRNLELAVQSRVRVAADSEIT